MIQSNPTSKIRSLSVNRILSLHDGLERTDPECLSKTFMKTLLQFGEPKQRQPRKPHIKNSNGLKNYWSDPNNRFLASERMKKRYSNPMAREKTSLGNLKRYSRESERLKTQMLAKCRVSTPETRMKLVEYSIGGFWYGNVRYYSGPRYCDKWTYNLKERVRAFFGYRCIECGNPQRDRLLHVHHVWYNKQACCDNTPKSLVPLCHSCHSKTSAKKNRLYWSEHFQFMIDTYYGGKCWFTKEEMTSYILGALA
jgi:hypothetical protein